MPILGHQISRELLDALGLPKHTASFSLHCRAGQFVTVDCEYYPDDLASVERAFSSYTLERREPPAAPPEHPAVLMGFDAWMRERTERAHAEFMARTSIMLEVDRRKVLVDLLYKHVVRPLVLRVAEAVRTA